MLYQNRHDHLHQVSRTRITILKFILCNCCNIQSSKYNLCGTKCGQRGVNARSSRINDDCVPYGKDMLFMFVRRTGKTSKIDTERFGRFLGLDLMKHFWYGIFDPTEAEDNTERENRSGSLRFAVGEIPPIGGT